MEDEYSLVREALVREIGDAKHWSSVVEAWQALLAVRRMAEQLLAEQEHLSGNKTYGKPDEETNRRDRA